jgi:hypothetical protein
VVAAVLDPTHQEVVLEPVAVAVAVVLVDKVIHGLLLLPLEVVTVE